MPLRSRFQPSGCRPFQTFSLPPVCPQLSRACPHLLSSSRVVQGEADPRLPLAAFLATRFGRGTGRWFLDSPPLKLCPHWRSNSPQVFTGRAYRGVSRPGGFSGFTGPRVLTAQGARLAVLVPPGHGADPKPGPQLARRVCGQLCGARGSLSPARFPRLGTQGLP